MILEVARLTLRRGEAERFEAAFAEAQAIIAASPGFLSHELLRGLEHPDEYLLLVRWQTLHDHEVGFRQSAAYAQWKALLHPFYAPAPSVLHYEPRFGAARRVSVQSEDSSAE